MPAQVEEQITRWRTYVSGARGLDGADVDELESHLRDQIEELQGVGLAGDEAFLVAVRRLGEVSALSREFAREHRGRLWRQLVLANGDGEDRSQGDWVAPLLFASGAAAVVTVARLLSGAPFDIPVWLLRNAGVLVLPFLAAFFAWRRQLPVRTWLLTAVPFIVAALVVNLVVPRADPDAAVLAAAHLPVALWFVVGSAYMGGVIGSHERRMDLVRFTGEWLIYYVLIALGGGVLTGLSAAVLAPAGVDGELIVEWVLPTGAVGAVVIAAWLVESKQHVVENMAPVLTTVFTPLFAIMLSIAAIVYAASGFGGGFDRDLLAVFDVLLVVVLGLVLYATSARSPSTPPGWMDRIQLVAVVAALVLDVMVLVAMLGRVGALGFTPNRTVALGLNLLLLVNLAGSAWLTWRFVTGRGTFHRLERWQTAYLPVFACWAAAVVLVVPLVF